MPQKNASVREGGPYSTHMLLALGSRSLTMCDDGGTISSSCSSSPTCFRQFTTVPPYLEVIPCIWEVVLEYNLPYSSSLLPRRSGAQTKEKGGVSCRRKNGRSRQQLQRSRARACVLRACITLHNYPILHHPAKLPRPYSFTSRRHESSVYRSSRIAALVTLHLQTAVGNQIRVG